MTSRIFSIFLNIQVILNFCYYKYCYKQHSFSKDCSCPPTKDHQKVRCIYCLSQLRETSIKEDHGASL